MRKSTVILIAVVLIASFSWVVYYGVRHSRGIPVTIEEPERIVLEARFINKNIDFAKGVSPDIWSSIPPNEIELTYQLMVLPWGKSLVSPITVKAFHNGGDIYFYMSWKDDTENRNLEIKKFSDACAVMFPMDDEAQPSSIMMGFLGKANIWQWKASQDMEYWLKELPETEAYVDFYYPFEEEELFPVSLEVHKSAANDLMAIRVGTITPKEAQNVSGRGFWKDGVWEVVFKRSFEAEDPEIDAVFGKAEKKLCAFAVWNGEKGDRGGRKSISDWVELEVKRR